MLSQSIHSHFIIYFSYCNNCKLKIEIKFKFAITRVRNRWKQYNINIDTWNITGNSKSSQAH